MKIGVVGGGVVGQATARSYLEYVDEVRVFDLVSERRTHALEEVLSCEIVFVCLPTPQKKSSLECDLSVVEKFFFDRTEVRLWDKANYVLRSTVPIGTTRRLRAHCRLPNLVHSPEFLTARCALVDAQLPARNIIGGYYERGVRTPCAKILHDLYERRWPHVPVLRMEYEESEAVKLFQNSFFAVKVAFWNEVEQLAGNLSLNWDAIHSAILSDGRIHPSHTQVPGPDGKFGFGGTCLPKDIADLITCMRSAGVRTDVCEAALRRNEFDRRREE